MILLTVGGIPSVYAGDEFGFRGVKEERYGGDDAVRPEFGSPPAQLDASGAQVWALHQYLIGLRRRHAWLHSASTTALRLDNRHYVYQTRSGDDALLVALNIDDAPLHLALSGAGHGASTGSRRVSGAASGGRRRRWSSSPTAGGY